jgi:STE24 endopeptidase
VLFFFILTLLTFPLDYYSQFYREHLYDFSQQSLSSWFGDYMKGFLIGLLFGGLLIVVLYSVFRKSPNRWWVWGTVVAIVFVILSTAVVPEFIAPLFNKYEPIKNQQLRSQVLALAEAHGIHPKDVYEVDASKQSNKIGAFVFGLLGTQRIVLTDTLIQRCSPREILVVVGHEMGHYILNHIWKGIAVFAVLLFFFGYLLQWILTRVIRKHQSRLGFREISDIASLPLLLFILSLLFFVFTPFFNTFSRHLEAEADWYGLASTGYWLAEISVDKKLGEYREMDPHPLIEFLFFDHPSGKDRIKMGLEYRDKYGNKPILPGSTEVKPEN